MICVSVLIITRFSKFSTSVGVDVGAVLLRRCNTESLVQAVRAEDV